MCNIIIMNMHCCKLLVTKPYTSLFRKRLANSRFQTVSDMPVEEVRRDLRDWKIWARVGDIRTPGSKGGPSWFGKTVDIQIITVQVKNTLRYSCLDLCNCRTCCASILLWQDCDWKQQDVWYGFKITDVYFYRLDIERRSIYNISL